jgi:SAM-dependent methyltransferase
VAATLQPLRAPSVHRTPAARFVDRLDAVRALVRGRTVIDLGFVDEGQMDSKRGHGLWLHEIVSAEARACVGLDSDEAGVARANARGFNALVADVEDAEALAALALEPAEVVLAGELIEHLDRPGDFLEAVKVLVAPGGSLVLTTPNAHALTNVFGALLRRELVNADHVAWLSWRTATTLLERHGWLLEQVAYYRFPRVRSGSAAGRLLFNAYQAAAAPIFRLRPALADGLILVARRA